MAKLPWLLVVLGVITLLALGILDLSALRDLRLPALFDQTSGDVAHPTPSSSTPSPATASPSPTTAAVMETCTAALPRFVHGVAALKAVVGTYMGEPVECERVTDAAGDTEQRTTTGLAYYRAASNTVAFTNGWDHWALTGALERLAGRNDRSVGAAEQMLVAENAIALSAMRATFGRAANLVDVFQQEHLPVDATADELGTAFAEVQAAKTFVDNTPAAIVQRALTLSGGAGDMRAHPWPGRIAMFERADSCSRSVTCERTITWPRRYLASSWSWPSGNSRRACTTSPADVLGAVVGAAWT